MSTPPESLPRAFLAYLQRHHLLAPGSPVCVAISGGADSVALAHLLHRMGHPLTLLHCNFRLRGDASDGDEAFVRALAAAWDVPVWVEAFDTEAHARAHRLSVQLAARQLRYGWLDTWTALGHIVATAHHRTDLAETALMSLLRGKDFAVLQGIPRQRDGYIRPLLFASRAQLRAWLESEELPWREDASNAETKYLRNYLRHEVFPRLQEVHPDPEAQLAERTAHHARQMQVLDALLTRLEPDLVTQEEGGYVIHLELLHRLDVDTQELFLYHWLENRAGLDYHAIQRVQALTQSQTGRRVEAGSYVFQVDRARLVVRPPSRPVPDSAPPTAPHVLQPGQTVIIGPTRLRVERYPGIWPLPLTETEAATGQQTDPPVCIWLNPDALVGSLILRRWRAGDRMQPLGMRGTRKVSDILTDMKYPTDRRGQAWVLADDEGVVYVEGFRIAERVRARPGLEVLWRVGIESS